jgi:hypothetical protein
MTLASELTAAFTRQGEIQAEIRRELPWTTSRRDQAGDVTYMLQTRAGVARIKRITWPGVVTLADVTAPLDTAWENRATLTYS